MHLFYIPQCCIQNINMHISVLNGTLWDMEQVHSGICELGHLFNMVLSIKWKNLSWWQLCCHWLHWKLSTWQGVNQSAQGTLHFSVDILTHIPPGQNGRHFTNDIFRCIFKNEKFCIFIQISLKFVPKGPIDINPVLVLLMAWCQIGNKPLSEPMLTWFADTYMRH